MAAAIHLHRIEGDDDSANVDAVAHAPGLHDAVVIAFARREQGLLVAPGNPLKLYRHRLGRGRPRAHGAAAARRRRAAAAAGAAGAEPASPSRR